MRAQMERLDALLELIQDIAVAANQAQTAAVAFQTAVQRICEYAEWSIGHVYLRSDDGSGDLVSSGIWHCGGAEGSGALRDASLKARFAPQEDLIWRVVESGEPVWIEEITRVRIGAEAQPRPRPVSTWRSCSRSRSPLTSRG